MARKEYDYRCDILSEVDRAALLDLISEIDTARKDASLDNDRLQKLVIKADNLLRRTGGHFYPRSFWAEHIEMILVAGILAIGIRTFFFQPFKIPTNSMYPTYNGMTHQVYADPQEAPGPLGKMFRFVTLGSRHIALTAPVSGEVSIVRAEPALVPGRKLGVFPTVNRRWLFMVGNEVVPLDLPAEFDFSGVLQSMLSGPNVRQTTGRAGVQIIQTGLQVQQGETFLAFDLLTGDQLFVDRLSYHFRSPRVGEPFVFVTDNIEHMPASERGKYYIKRIAGAGGDELLIEPPVLLRNGAPATGAPAFQYNAGQEGRYNGYVHFNHVPGALFPGTSPIHVPEGHFFALGDNSPNSSDSRVFGFVPETEVIGRAIFIYYPFSQRWGRSR
ncbi:MAG: signal peptidase I [Verrucomicrobia bacterium]|nr:signal peptidase I [Verrucomicrobiota bacterium]